jgi:hypothetical protein
VPSFVSSSLFKRAAIGVGVMALAVGAIGSTAASASQPATPTINTFGSWDGTTYIQPFGCPNTTTYGETITIPAGKTTLNKFIFTWTDLGTGSFKVRGEVYAWDPSTMHATGPALAQTPARTVTSGHSGFFTEKFNAQQAPVTAGQQYVIFASLDKNYASCNTSTYVVGWGAIPDDTVYPGGTFVYQNNGGLGGSANWTTLAWTSFGWDLAFKAFMS